MKVEDYVRTKDGRIYKIGDIGNFIYSEDDAIIQGIIKSIVTKEQFESMEYKI